MPAVTAGMTMLAGIASAEQDAGAEAGIVEELVVIAEPDRRIYELAETLDVTPDSAALLKRAVGANVVTNGPLTGMAQYRGMSRMRISSRINGQHISPGGPNWMDPPLSYAPAAHLESLEVHRGIAQRGRRDGDHRRRGERKHLAGASSVIRTALIEGRVRAGTSTR